MAKDAAEELLRFNDAISDVVENYQDWLNVL